MSDLKTTGGSGQESTEEYAQRVGMPVALLLPYEAVAIAQGSALVVPTEDGGRALVRLMTTPEYLKAQHAAADRYGGSRITLAQAHELARPRDVSR